MERALVVFDDTDRHRDLLREAGELAAGVDAELVLLSTMTEDEFEEDIETMAAISSVEHTSYGEQTILDTLRSFLDDTAEEVLDGLDVSYRSVGVVVDDDEHAEAILTVAEEEDCDHVFIRGRRRSPTGKALFGDTAQRIILNYDGPVTVSTA